MIPHVYPKELVDLEIAIAEIIAEKQATMAKFLPSNLELGCAIHTEIDLARHRKANLRKPWYQRHGGIRWLRLGRLTLSWSWRRQP